MTMRTLLALSIANIPSLKFSERLALLENLRSPEEFLSLRPLEVARALQRNLRNTVWEPGPLLRKAEQTLSFMEPKGIQCLTPLENSYPPQLREIYDPPFLLFYRGTLPTWNETFLAVVGTRQPTGLGRKSAYGIAKEAAGLGIVVVSGLALGIDGEAHRGALDGGGKTIAVLGHGPDTVYPVSNRYLGARILREGGVFLSEYPPGEPPKPYRFPARNRIISGLCRGTLVVEAPEGSGALITADYALEQGRDLLVHQVGLESPRGEGIRKLRDDGAPVVASCGDILRCWGMGSEQLKRDPDRQGGDKDSLFPQGEALTPGQWLANQLKKELGRKR